MMVLQNAHLTCHGEGACCVYIYRMSTYHSKCRCPLSLQNHIRKIIRFSPFSGLFAAVLSRSGPVFCTEKQRAESRKALTAFPERRFPRVFGCRFRAKKQPFFCRKGLLALQRGCFRSATAALRQRNKGLIATSGGPYGGTAASPRRSGENAAARKRL